MFTIATWWHSGCKTIARFLVYHKMSGAKIAATQGPLVFTNRIGRERHAFSENVIVVDFRNLIGHVLTLVDVVHDVVDSLEQR